MDRRDDLLDDHDDALEVDAPRRSSPHAPWVRLVAAGVVILVVLATFIGALL